MTTSLPQASAPLQSLTRAPSPAGPHGSENPSRGPVPKNRPPPDSTRFRSPEVSCPFSATPAGGSHHPRACLTRVTLRPRAFPAPRRLPPPPTWPVSLNRLRSWGFTLQRFPRHGSPLPLGSASPPAMASSIPKDGRGSLQGLPPRDASDRTPLDLSARHARPALLGFSLPGAFPSRASDLAPVAPATGTRPPPRSPPSRTTTVSADLGPPLVHFGRSPRFRVPFPVLQSVKEHGNRLVSRETAGPSEVCVLVPLPSGSPRPGAGVGPAVRPPLSQGQS